MGKRKKQKNRDAFTDALGEEISSRKNLNLDNHKKSTPKVDLTKKNKPKVRVKPAESVEIVKVEVNKEFVKRVLAEADNTFYDEKPARPKRKLTSESITTPQRPTFRTKSMIERLAEENSKDGKDIVINEDLHRKLTRAETAGAVLSFILLVYSLTTADKPLFFVTLSLFTHTLRPLIGGFFGKYNRPVQNALRGFSIVIFFGALVMLII